MPNSSMLKFFDEQGGPDSDHGGKLHWPGTQDGYPFRGDQVPHLKADEINNISLALDYKSEMFELWDPIAKTRFDEVMERIVNGWYMQHKRRDIEVEGQLLPAVWLEWVQVYGETPSGKHPAGEKAHDQTTTIQPGAGPQGPLNVGTPATR